MENEQDKISVKEIQELLSISHQALYNLKWLPGYIECNKKGIRMFDRKSVMVAIEKNYEKPKEPVYTIQPSRFYDAMKDLVANYDQICNRGNANKSYKKYKIVQNRGDIMLACRLKKDTSRPWIYERRRECLIDKASIKR